MNLADWQALPRCGQPTRAGTPCRRFAGPTGTCGRHRPGSSPISPAAAPAPDRPLVDALAALVRIVGDLSDAEAAPPDASALPALDAAVRRALAARQQRDAVGLVVALDGLELVYRRVAIESERLGRLAQLRAERRQQLDAVAAALDAAGVAHTGHDADALTQAASAVARLAAARRPTETEPAAHRKKRAAGSAAYGDAMLAKGATPARVSLTERDAPPAA